jgi:hypothetical protein
VIHQHDDRNIRPDLLNLVGDGRAIEEAEVVLEDHCMHGPRHEKPETIGTISGGCQLVSAFLQQTQFRGIPVYAEQGAIGSHAVYVYQGRFPQICAKLLNPAACGTSSLWKTRAGETSIDLLPAIQVSAKPGRYHCRFE